MARASKSFVRPRILLRVSGDPLMTHSEGMVPASSSMLARVEEIIDCDTSSPNTKYFVQRPQGHGQNEKDVMMPFLDGMRQDGCHEFSRDRRAKLLAVRIRRFEKCPKPTESSYL